MQDKIVKAPGPTHPIDIQPVRGEVVVRLNSQVLAKTSSALVLHEAAERVDAIQLADASSSTR